MQPVNLVIPVSVRGHRGPRSLTVPPPRGHLCARDTGEQALKDGPSHQKPWDPGACRGCSEAGVPHLCRLHSRSHWGWGVWPQHGLEVTALVSGPDRSRPVSWASAPGLRHYTRNPGPSLQRLLSEAQRGATVGAKWGQHPKGDPPASHRPSQSPRPSVWDGQQTHGLVLRMSSSGPRSLVQTKALKLSKREGRTRSLPGAPHCQRGNR